MPKYKYCCHTCQKEWEMWHSLDDPPQKCSCGSSKFYRAPSFISKKQEKKGVVKIGTITKDHIEESKKELLQQKKELREEELK